MKRTIFHRNRHDGLATQCGLNPDKKIGGGSNCERCNAVAKKTQVLLPSPRPGADGIFYTEADAIREKEMAQKAGLTRTVVLMDKLLRQFEDARRAS